MKALSRFFLIGVFAAGSMAFTGAAQAGSDLSWSLTLGTPGVVVGVMPPAPVYYGAPVYVEPYPVYRVERRHYRPHPHMRGPHRAYRHRGDGPRHGYRRSHGKKHHHR